MSNQPLIQWAVDGAGLIKYWCEDNGYVPYTKLREELEIPKTVWTNIMVDFRAISSVVEAYAAIFKRTGITHFDPRTLPPRSKGLGLTKQERKWTDEQYQNWLKNPVVPGRIPRKRGSKSEVPQKAKVVPPVGTPKPLRLPAPKERAAKPSTAPLETAISLLVDELTRHLLGEFRTLVREELTQVFNERQLHLKAQLPVVESQNRDENPTFRQAVATFTKEMRRLSNSSAQAKAEFVRQYGRDLTFLLPYIEAFSLPDESKREDRLKGISTLDLR